MDTYDVVVIGGGIGGGSIATGLSRVGLGVCVVEPTTEYPDLVRGEWLAPWGVAHAQATGLYDVLMRAGGRHMHTHVSFDEGIHPDQARANALPIADLVPGTEGPLCLRHPIACQALADAAVEAGATVIRGAEDIAVRPDQSVAFRVGSEAQEVRSRIVIGADGRSSPTRKAIGVELERADSGHFLAGLLVDGIDFMGDENVQHGAAEAGLYALFFPQGGGRARLYLNYDDHQKSRFGGSNRAQSFLDALPMRCWPGSEGFLNASPAGPANGYRSVDTWCERPYTDGVVLIGDAAGHNDPLIGQGLSITLADVRLVSEALLSSRDWSPALFDSYGKERRERLRRLHTTARVYALAIAGRAWASEPDVRARLQSDPIVGALLAAALMGPFAPPDELYEPSQIDQLLAQPTA